MSEGAGGFDPEVVRAIEAGADLFNKREFFEAHEVWEEAWGDSQMDERHLLQGLIQVAAGFYKLQIGQPSGTAKLLEKALQHLKPLPQRFYNIDLADMVHIAERWQSRAVEMVESWQTAYAEEELPRLRFVEQ